MLFNMTLTEVFIHFSVVLREKNSNNVSGMGYEKYSLSISGTNYADMCKPRSNVCRV